MRAERQQIYGRTARVRIAIGLTIALIVILSDRVRAADDLDKIQAEVGRQWYETYCTSCHGVAGAPGSAVYPDTKKPVDLRDYIKHNGGRFPAERWIYVVTADNPSLVHTDVWHDFRESQKGRLSADAAARGIVASIACYVRSIQK